MRMTIRWHAAAMGIMTLLSSACLEPGSGRPMDGDASDTLAGIPSPEVQPEPLACTAGQWLCLDPSTTALCAATGVGYDQTLSCAEGVACSALTGACGGAPCEPGSSICVDDGAYVLCHESGTDWEPESVSCPEDGLCHLGACVACLPGSTTCADGVSVSVCAPGGAGHNPPIPCPSGHVCLPSDGVCVEAACAPGEIKCMDSHTFIQCTEVGDAWLPLATCELGSLCVDGGCAVCPLGATYCADEVTQMSCDETSVDGYAANTCGPYKTCHEPQGICAWGPWPCMPGLPDCVDQLTVDECALDGSAWAGIPEECPEGKVCNFGTCVEAECQANVMFLVDRSGSMQGQLWEDVLTSLGVVIHGNRAFRYGIRFFPPTDGPYVDGPPEPHLPLGVLNSFAVLLNLFTDWAPDGNTPMVGMLSAIAADPDAFFEGDPGALVVLTDGQPGCWPSPGICHANLVEATESLWDGNGIRLFPIGFAYGGDVGYLDTIAMHGGSGLSHHIAAADASQLTDVLMAIVDELDECD